MRMHALVYMLSFLAGFNTPLEYADPPAPPLPKADAIRFPAFPATPVPPGPGPVIPIPGPTPVVKLTAGQIYVIEADVAAMVTTSPPGLATVTVDSGPIKIRGQFVESPGKNQTKVFSGKTVYTIEPSGVGRVEIIVVPTGAVNEKDIQRTLLDVDDGTKPIPPPVPPTPPAPPTPPKPPAPIAEKGLRVLIVYDGDKLPNAPASLQTILFSTALRTWMSANCVKGADGKSPEWRVWSSDIDTTGESDIWQKAMKRNHPTLPWILISNGDTGYEGPLPTTSPADVQTLMEKYKGGN